MQLLGSAFHFQVPDGWQEAREPGCVIAAAPVPLLGFTPNVVLRESVVQERPDALAAISQANLRSFSEVPGSLVLQVEALQRLGVEHRRIWMLTPATPEELHGNILCLLSIQELVISAGVIAELTLTLPFVEWAPGDQHQAILETLQLLPPAEQKAPPTTANMPEAVLDEWATARYGAAREDLSVVALPHLILQAEPLVLSDEAVTVFFTNAERGFTPVTGHVKDELFAADLVEQDGALSPAGFWYLDHVLSGKGWNVTAAAQEPREFRFWLTNATTIFTAPHPEQTGKKLLGYCPSNDLFRILLAWLGATPAWPMDVNLKLSLKQMQTKAEQNQVTFACSGDGEEFANQHWTVCSLTSSGKTYLIWINTQSRGSAVAWADPSLLNFRNLISVHQQKDMPLWLHLISMIAENP